MLYLTRSVREGRTDLRAEIRSRDHMGHRAGEFGRELIRGRLQQAGIDIVSADVEMVGGVSQG